MEVLPEINFEGWDNDSNGNTKDTKGEVIRSWLDVPVYMKIPHGIDIENGSKDEYLVSLKSSLYGLKQSGANWYDFLKKGI